MLEYPNVDCWLCAAAQLIKSPCGSRIGFGEKEPLAFELALVEKEGGVLSWSRTFATVPPVSP